MDTERCARIIAQKVAERTGIIVYVSDDRDRRAVDFWLRDEMDPFFTATDSYLVGGVDAETVIENELYGLVRKRFPLKVGL